MEILKLVVVMFCLSHLVETFSHLLPNKKIFSIVQLIMSCKSCSSFWMTLFLAQDIFLASLVWLIMFIYVNLIEPKINVTEL